MTYVMTLEFVPPINAACSYNLLCQMLTEEMHVYSVNGKEKKNQNTYLEITLFNKYSSSLNIVYCDLVLNDFTFLCRP